MIRFALALTALCSCVVTHAAEPPATAPAAGDLRVMSFNIRLGTAKDGENHWDKRKDLLLERIRAYNPDLLGTQEVVAFQADFLREQFPAYGFVGGGRDDGKRGGEFSPIMFRTDRFELLAHGQYWLSDTPEKVGSRGWDAALPRIATWARLRDKTAGRSLLVVNTHWDHKGQQARAESAKLMRTMLDKQRDGLPVIVMGDFNTTETGEPYRTMTAGELLRDAYRAVHAQPQEEEASFNGFKGTKTGKRIDWILHTAELRPKEAAIDRTNRNGRYPSDHYPVTAVLEWGK